MQCQGVVVRSRPADVRGSKVELDGKEVATFLHGDFGMKREGNYTSTSHPLTATK